MQSHYFQQICHKDLNDESPQESSFNQDEHKGQPESGSLKKQSLKNNDENSEHKSDYFRPNPKPVGQGEGQPPVEPSQLSQSELSRSEQQSQQIVIEPEPIIPEPSVKDTDPYGFEKDDHNRINNPSNSKLVINARIEKWRQMCIQISNQPHSEKLQKKIKERARKGVPGGMRKQVWPVLARVDDMKADAVVRHNCATYEAFLHKMGHEYKYEKQIALDVGRTFPSNVYFKQFSSTILKSLTEVLKALSVALPKIGYCQGMNFLAAAVILVTDDANAFWILYSLLTRYQHQAIIFIEPSKVKRECFILEAMVLKYFPEIPPLLQKNNIELLLICSEWFVTLFSSILPINLFYRVFEIFLVEGEKALFRCALAIFQHKRAPLKRIRNFDEQFRLLKDLDLNSLNPDAFVRSMHSFTFSRKWIEELDKRYSQQQR